MKRFASRIRSKPILALALLAALSTAAVVEAQTSCRKTIGFFCKSITTLQPYNGPPPIPVCPVGEPIVQIDSIAKCLGVVAGPVRVLRCGFLSETFSYSGGVFLHNFGVAPGANWEDVMNGSCQDLLYSVTLVP
ncbi:MAG: hypothetical protein GY711_14660 [bacterium]|nr:hypothetical protein [bacterium]